jgi:hypothetical protein
MISLVLTMILATAWLDIGFNAVTFYLVVRVLWSDVPLFVMGSTVGFRAVIAFASAS